MSSAGRRFVCLFVYFLFVLGVTVRREPEEGSSADTQTVVLDIDVSGGTMAPSSSSSPSSSSLWDVAAPSDRTHTKKYIYIDIIHLLIAH